MLGVAWNGAAELTSHGKCVVAELRFTCLWQSGSCASEQPVVR